MFLTTAFKTLVLLGLVAGSTAHHMVSNIYIDGTDQGAGTCLRIPPSTVPVNNIHSSEMTCNVGGLGAVAFTCAANAGSQVTAQWRTWPDGTRDAPLDVSHQGPCAVYMKFMGTESAWRPVTGEGWFKVYQDGYRDGAFCTERIRNNGNKMTFTIPKDLARGHYTIRFESLALHQAQEAGGAQWYIGCAQVFVYSTGGSRKPTDTVSIPGHVHTNDPGVLYNLWGGHHTGYKIPGPAPYITTSSGGGSPIKTPFNPHPKYPQCVVKNANWCAVPVPNFNSEASCYSAVEKCWSQLNTCYKTAPPTGYTGCRKYEEICASYQKHCQACGRGCNGSFPKLKVRSAPRHIPHGRPHSRHVA